MPNDNSWLIAFKTYITDIRSLSSLFGKGIFLVPIITGLIFNLGPPWPAKTGVTFLTTLAEILISMYVFQRAFKAKKDYLSKWLNITIALTVFSLLAYLLTFSFFVRDMPDSDNKDVRGIYYTPQARAVINEQYTEEKALRGAGYEPTVIWVPWTVYLMRVVVIIFWLVFFCSLSSYIALFVLWQRNSNR